MMTETNVAAWPSITDVMRETGLSQTTVYKLVVSGKVRSIRTRLGYLIDPESVAEFVAGREARKAKVTR